MLYMRSDEKNLRSYGLSRSPNKTMALKVYFRTGGRRPAWEGLLTSPAALFIWGEIALTRENPASV